VKEGGGWIRMELENNKRKTDGTTGSAVAGGAQTIRLRYWFSYKGLRVPGSEASWTEKVRPSLQGSSSKKKWVIF